ncbi:hypothetical protein K443DRAFT_677507 [Laccaria amethystina LaAM-08-1]|uniref:Uncharacterized protein n=1 Tax=Laccaria amethystina LaAM-08-1 TaxID=1095629 RepID=A0A0C9XY21_9AGAR|nr:hypothetical protein K443DRAFT_677507 [Laccaria amethystina LaAM-08-1]
MPCGSAVASSGEWGLECDSWLLRYWGRRALRRRGAVAGLDLTEVTKNSEDLASTEVIIFNKSRGWYQF